MLRLPGILMASILLALPAVTGFAQSPPAPGATPSTPAPAAPGPEKPAPTAPASPTDPFGQEVTLNEKTIIYFKGTGNWDAAFDTIVDGFKTVKAYMDKAGLQATGPATTIYTATDDTSFSFQAAFPIAEAPKDPPKGDIAIGKSPTGKALKFVHRGSYDSMDTTYEAITNYLDDKQLDAKDLFIEEYQTDPVATPEDKLVIGVYVPIR